MTGLGGSSAPTQQTTVSEQILRLKKATKKLPVFRYIAPPYLATADPPTALPRVTSELLHDQRIKLYHARSDSLFFWFVVSRGSRPRARDLPECRASLPSATQRENCPMPGRGNRLLRA